MLMLKISPHHELFPDKLASLLPSPCVALAPAASGKRRCKKIIMNEEQSAKAMQEAMTDMTLAYGKPTRKGCQRLCWIADKVVYKLPLLCTEWKEYLKDPDGYLLHYMHPKDFMPFAPSENIKANIVEVMAYKRKYLSKPIAPCRLVYHTSGIPIVVMERLNMRKRPDYQFTKKEWKEWVDDFDGGQVAWSDSENSFVGYDAGFPPYRIDCDQWYEVITHEFFNGQKP